MSEVFKCDRCKGSGRSRQVRDLDCAACGGSGYRRKCDSVGCAEFGCEGHGNCYVSAAEASKLKGAA